MKKPARSQSLLARARAYTRQHAGRTALTIAPLATLGLSAESARAVGPTNPVFNPTPSSVTYGNNPAGGNTGFDSNYLFYTNNGNITGSALAKGANGATGAKFQGSVGFTDTEGGFAGEVGNIQMFSLTSTGSGAFSAASGSIPISYDFTLASSVVSGDQLAITGWQLNISVTSSTGTGTAMVSNTTGGPGLFTGTTSVTVPGAAAGATFTGYAASLTVNYSIGAASGNGGDTLSVTVPANSIDINAVPEPSTWVILATGVAGAGFGIMRVRERRARTAPAV